MDPKVTLKTLSPMPTPHDGQISAKCRRTLYTVAAAGTDSLYARLVRGLGALRSLFNTAAYDP